MSRRAVIVALTTLAATALAALPDGVDGPRKVYSRGFPDGSGREIAVRWCQMCHAPTLVTQQAKDSTGWEKTLVQMEKWGVQLSPAEHDTLRGYLLARFGPRKR